MAGCCKSSGSATAKKPEAAKTEKKPAPAKKK